MKIKNAPKAVPAARARDEREKQGTVSATQRGQDSSMEADGQVCRTLAGDTPGESDRNDTNAAEEPRCKFGNRRWQNMK